MSMIPTEQPSDYSDGMTKQAFKDEVNINKILARAAKGNTISHLAKHGAVYGDFSDITDLLGARARLDRAQQIFAELPGEVRREFDQDVGKFFMYVNDPANIERLPELLPGLAAPGNQMPRPVRTPANQRAAPDSRPAAPAPEASPPPENTPAQPAT